MFDLIAKLFIKNHNDISDPEVRQKYGLLSGIMGMICNVVLFILKLSVGLVISSVAVVTDAFNNLSDMGSTVVSLVGIRLSNKKPDSDHPFGHGRLEYISALIVSFIIMLVGFELLRTSFDCILHPEEAADINWLMIILLAISLPVKLFMFFLNKHFGKRISSQPLLATAKDSRNDCIATLAVIISAVIDGLRILPFAIDGYVGSAVSLLIMWAGFGVAKDTVDLLLGKAPDEETVKKISEILEETPEIIGIHDLIVHDYGPGRLLASVHAEVDSDSDIISAHEAIDAAEQKIFSSLGCLMTIHLDPVLTNNETLEGVRTVLKEYISRNSLNITFHDLRMTDGMNSINIIFDIVVPASTSEKEANSIASSLKETVRSINGKFNTVINIDKDFADILSIKTQ